MINARCSKVTCRTTNADMMACRKLARYLKQWNFEMNPYYPGVQNTMVMNKHLTLLVHIDDVVLTYEMANEVMDQIKLLDKVHGKNDPLNATCSKLYEGFGMTIDYRKGVQPSHSMML